MNSYEKFCKPSLARALHSLGLDKIFHRAEGAYLYCNDESGSEEKVIDWLGGYGATILGHNPPSLVQKAQTQLSEGIAFHNQFSLRMGAAKLSEYLNPILKQETKSADDFLFAYANSGAESVEVAIKHAEIKRVSQLEHLEKKLNASYQNLNDSSLKVQLNTTVYEKLGVDAEVDVSNLSEKLKKYNASQLNRAPQFIALKHAFHGKLTGSIQLTHGEMYRQPFKRFGLSVSFYSLQDLLEKKDSLFDELNAWLVLPRIENNEIVLEEIELPLVAAMFVEAVQGEGGVYVLNEEEARTLNNIRDQWGCPMIADEIQSGCGRCGSFLAGSQVGLKPDYVILSKGLGGAISKLGVVAIREGAYSPGFDIIQSSTFGEDDYSAGIALEFVKLLEQNDGEVYRKVQSLGKDIKIKLEILQKEFPDIIKGVRGKGLLLGVEFADQSNALSHMLRTVAYQGAMGYLLSGHMLNESGVRVAPPASAANVVRLEPSILTTQEDIDSVINCFARLCLALRYQDAYYILRYLTKESSCETFDDMPRDYRHSYSEEEIQSLKDYSNRSSTRPRVAFINHLISADWLAQVDPSFYKITPEKADVFIRRMAFDRRSIPFPPVKMTSKLGNEVDFSLYPLTFTSAQIEEKMANNELDDLRSAIDERIQSAHDDGCIVAGLGMFTSIATNNCKSVEVPGIGLTTGNALTVAMASQALKTSIQQKNVQLNCAAVVGAAGNIGSVYAAILSENVKQLILVGSGRTGSTTRLLKTAHKVYEECWLDIQNKPVSDLSGIAKEIYSLDILQVWLSDPKTIPEKTIGKVIREKIVEHYQDDPFVLVTDNIQNIGQAEVVLCAANASSSFLNVDIFKENAIICDVAVPHNIGEELLQARPDITCLRGGLVATPNNESLSPRAKAYLGEGQIYACMAETAVLGLENYRNHYSYGNLNRSQVKNIYELAVKHGFSLAEIKSEESM